MSDVIAIRVSKDRINPAAMEDVINKLIVAKYPPPLWVRRGPNWAENTETKEAVNLNQEATAILVDNPPREDVVATVDDGAGGREDVWIDQAAVKAVGGDLALIKKNLQTVLTGAGVPAGLAVSPKMILILAGAGVGLWYLAKRKG